MSQRKSLKMAYPLFRLMWIQWGTCCVQAISPGGSQFSIERCCGEFFRGSLRAVASLLTR
jgi:hypothetical protein